MWVQSSTYNDAVVARVGADLPLVLDEDACRRDGAALAKEHFKAQTTPRTVWSTRVAAGHTLAANVPLAAAISTKEHGDDDRMGGGGCV